MTARTSFQSTAQMSTPPAAATPTGRPIWIGTTQRGPIVPTLVTGWADWQSKFGARISGAEPAYDACQEYFADGGAQLYFQRAYGPAAAKATRSLSAGNLVVTAKHVGAYGNAITCAWNSTTKVLTVIADGNTETYQGTTAAAVLTAAAISKTVDVTSNGTLPAADVASANLASGADDAANAVQATILGLLTQDLGTGMVSWLGKDYTSVGTALADHAAATERLAYLTCASGADTSALTTAMAAVAAYTNGSKAIVGWPYLVRPDGVTIEPTGFAAACRARANAVIAGTPPWGATYGKCRTGLKPVSILTDAQFTTMDALRASIIQPVYGVTTLYGWHTAAPMPGNVLLDEASQADALNAIAHEVLELTTGWLGRLSTRANLASWAGDISGILAKYAAANVLTPPDPSVVPAGVEPDRGYIVDTGPSVNSPADLAAGNVKALIQVRFTGSIEFASTTVSATDASALAF